jgi:acetamidase/formamidase
MKNAVVETVSFLGATKGLSKPDAYSLASIGVDYGVAEAVDGTLLIYGAIAKKMFKTKTEYWLKK